MEDYDYLEKNLDPDRLLLIDFEGFVNNYDDYKSVVDFFLGNMKDKHKFKKKYFDPVVSKNNIGVYKNYLNKEDIKELAELEDWYFNKVRNRNIELIARNLNPVTF